MFTVFFLLVLLLSIYAWYSRMRLKEQALELVKDAIDKSTYQLLDDAIGLSQMRILRQGRRFYLMQTFEFQYADQERRYVGQAIRFGKTWLDVKFQTYLCKTPSQENDCKIIPFPGSS